MEKNFNKSFTKKGKAMSTLSEPGRNVVAYIIISRLRLGVHVYTIV